MAWFRPMGADEVAYHQATVLGRQDDHPGRALAYYGSRGETPLRWGGAGAARMGLAGEVTPEAYELAYGPGGFRHPLTGGQLVVTRRPGFELVVGAHKSVAVLGVAGDTEAMHSILDAETASTMDWLDGWFQACGGRRGRAQARTPTGGLTYAVTRHATSRAGDPSPHDHVLVANVVAMLDAGGACKALDSAALRDTVEAATMVGRLHSAARAVELGFRIEADDGPSGRLRHWRITGVPAEVCELFSKRSDEIAEYLAATGGDSYQARGIAARETRRQKRHTGPDQLVAGWHAELQAAGWSLDRLRVTLEQVRDTTRVLPFPLTTAEIDALAAQVLDIDGELLARHKVFTRTHLVAEIAPRLYGRDPADLDRVLAHITASRGVVPLIGVDRAREQAYTTTQVLEAEQTIARTVEALADRPGPTIEPQAVRTAIAAKEQAIGRALTAGQRNAVTRLCRPDSAVTVVVGVAGSGKTTALDAATTALEHGGYRVLGTSTSGQAARTLGEEADIDARTLASLLWRLEHRQVTLDARTVVLVDEAGMADDTDLARLTLAVHRAGAHLVLVGDHRQLAAVGPGGALAALLHRRSDLVVTLAENVRQRDRAERGALTQLRNGSVPDAVAWYAGKGRIHHQPTRVETLAAMVDEWAGDITGRHHTALLAWRRTDVADLNRLARHRWDLAGHLTGPDVRMPGGRSYATGDRVVALAPNPDAGIVTSEPLTVHAVDHQQIQARTADGRTVTLTGDAVDAEHLDHAYALTVHRAQGATFDRTHVLAAGGGRELAYVALSRARDRTTIHTTADDLTQAIDDLEADWEHERHQRWITDTPATIGLEHEPRPAVTEPVRSRRLRDLLGLPDAPTAVHAAELELRTRRLRLQQLRTGSGPWRDTPEGHAARNLADTRSRLEHAQQQLASPDLRRRDRRAATRNVGQCEAALNAAEHRWHTIGEPRVQQLEAAVTNAEHNLTRRRAEQMQHRLTLGYRALERDTPEHELERPSVAERLAHLEIESPSIELGL